MRISEIISEAVGDHYLYHGTSPRNAAKILYMNLLVGRTKQMFAGWRGRFKEKDIDTTRGEDAVMGVSLTRSPHFAKKWTTGGGSGSMANQQGVPGVIFVIDAIKLRQRYRVVPMEYFQHNGTSMNRTEAEEFVVGDIKNFSNFIHEIQIPESTLAFIKKGDGVYNYSDLLKYPKIKVVKG